MTATLRPGPGDDPARWTAEVFAAGDHAGAARFGDPHTWQHHAARALLTGDAASFAALAQWQNDDVRLFTAAAHWIAGDRATALRTCAGSREPRTAALARLLAKPQCHVLAQLPWLPGQPTDLAGGARGTDGIVLRTLGHRRGDVPVHADFDVRQLLADGFAPDVYVAAMAEWHQLPPNLGLLPCPRFAHIADHDLHLQVLQPWLAQFDGLCVTDRSEWLDVQGLQAGPVVSFPKVFGVPDGLPPVPGTERSLDAFVSGTMLDPYHPDKAALLHELLATPDLELRLVNGFAGPMAFQALLAASRASFTYVRRPGAMPTRGMESLAMGCALALQEESVLWLYVGKEHGVVPWGPTTQSLGAALRTIRSGWDHFGPAAQRGARHVRRALALSRTAPQYLRFLLFQAALHDAARPAAPLARPSVVPCQQRLCVSRTWLPPTPVARRRAMQSNFRGLGARFAAHTAPATLLQMARELLCEYAHYHERGDVDAADRSLFADALGLLDRGCRHFPDHLVLHFVRARALLLCGDARERLRGLQLAHDVASREPAGWQVAADDDVMPFDFGSDSFDHRTYLDLLAAAAKGGPLPTGDLVRVLRASLWGHVARASGKLAWHVAAAALNPEFARFRLDLARVCLQHAPHRAEGLDLLAELTAGSAEFPAALRLLRQHAPERLASLPSAHRVLQRLALCTLDGKLRLDALFQSERRAPLAAQSLGPVASAGAARLGVLVPHAGAPAELAELLAELAQQTMAADLLVCVATPGALPNNVLAAAPQLAVRTVVMDEDTPHAERLMRLGAASKAPLWTVAGPGDRLRTDALATLVRELHDHPDAGVVFANEGWLPEPAPTFTPAACQHIACRPRCSPERLLHTDAVGLHPVWRAALHTRFGGFEPAFGAACEYEFWRRVAAHTEVRQLPVLLTLSVATADWRRQREVGADPAGTARAVLAHGGDVARFTPFQPLPATVLAPGLTEEADSHARLGLLDPAQRHDVRMLEQFYGTALLHGDAPLAAALLRFATNQLPSLIAPALAEATLRSTLGLPGAEAVLEAVAGREPYRALLARHRQRAPNAPPHPHPQQELEPCPT